MYLNNKNFPTAEDIMEAAMKVEYIIEKTRFSKNPSSYEIEKRLDYLNISCIQILEHWLIVYLPEQDKSPIKIMSTIDNIEAGWIFGFGVMKRIDQMYTELEIEFKKLQK